MVTPPGSASPRTRAPAGSATEGRTSRLRGVVLVLAMSALMWVSEIVDIAAGHRLDLLGIEPRDVDGLTGIVAAPFLHLGFAHLISNTVPFLLLGLIIAFNGAVRVLAVTVIVGLVSGLGVWLVAPPHTLTIGASGVVFGYAAYLVTRGVLNRRLGQLVIGALVVIVWGGVLLSSLIPHQGISWQAHLFGAIGGILAAAWLRDSRHRAGRVP